MRSTTRSLIEACACRPLEPPSSHTPGGPHNPLLFVRRDDLGVVLQTLRTKHPPGTEHWGFNHSKHNPDESYIASEDEIDMEAIVREALGDAAVYRLESFAEGLEAESSGGGSDD